MRYALALAAILLCACSPSMQSNEGTGVTLAVEPETVSPGQEVTLVLRNGLASPVGYNLCTSGLERSEGGAWQPVASDRVCTMELRSLAAGEEARYPLDLPGTLETGEYRFVTSVDMMGAAEGDSVTSGTFRVQ